MVRIEIHLSKEETEILDLIAKEQGRSRKNLSETEIRKLIVGWQKKIFPQIFNRRTMAAMEHNTYIYASIQNKHIIKWGKK